MSLILLIFGFVLGIFTCVNNPEITEKAKDLQESLLSKINSYKSKDNNEKKEEPESVVEDKEEEEKEESK